MSKHERLDRLTATMGSLYGERMKFFRESVESPNVMQIIERLELDFTNPVGTGEYRIPVRFAAVEAISRYSLLTWEGPNHPTVIMHHGSGETRYTSRPSRTFRAGHRKGVNLVAVSVPFNESMGAYLHGTGSLERFAFMLAASAVLTERLVEWLRDAGCTRIACTGVSLGGWITNLHFARYGSCDLYKPIFAGAAPDDLFLNTVYARLNSRKAKQDLSRITTALNFEDTFAQRDSGPVFPLMARFDQFIRLERQSGIYRPENVSILEKGHVTGASDYRAHRDHILARL